MCSIGSFIPPIPIYRDKCRFDDRRSAAFPPVERRTPDRRHRQSDPPTARCHRARSTRRHGGTDHARYDAATRHRAPQHPPLPGNRPPVPVTPYRAATAGEPVAAHETVAENATGHPSRRTASNGTAFPGRGRRSRRRPGPSEPCAAASRCRATPSRASHPRGRQAVTAVITGYRTA